MIKIVQSVVYENYTWWVASTLRHKF